MASTKDHQQLVDDIILELGIKNCRVWKNKTGKARALHDPTYVIAFGLVGSSDVTGIRWDGKRIELEVKTGNASQTKEQKAFGEMIKRFGGIYSVVRSVEDAIRAVFGEPEL
jgi:hypothetical protein